MRMSELVEKTGVNRETIRYYIREGLLPKPRKISRNMADYTHDCVDQIVLIKELQDRLFLPLAAIKKILRQGRISQTDQARVRLQSDYLRPLEHLLPAKVKGEATFIKITGIRADRLGAFEEWGIITPQLVDGQKVYSQEDLTIGKIISGYRSMGLGVEHGASATFLKEARDMVMDILDRSSADFDKVVRDRPPEEQLEMATSASEITAQLLYHFYRKLSQDLVDKARERLVEYKSDQAG